MPRLPPLSNPIGGFFRPLEDSSRGAGSFFFSASAALDQPSSSPNGRFDFGFSSFAVFDVIVGAPIAGISALLSGLAATFFAGFAGLAARGGGSDASPGGSCCARAGESANASAAAAQIARSGRERGSGMRWFRCFAGLCYIAVSERLWPAQGRGV